MTKDLTNVFERIYPGTDSSSRGLETRIIKEMPEAILNKVIVIISAAGILISLLLVVLLGRLKRPGLVMT